MTKRRDFIKGVSLTALGLTFSQQTLFANLKKRHRIKPGLVTYLWGKDWDVPTIIRNCEKTNLLGVELRTEHKHGVEPSLSQAQRREVKQRFKDSEVEFIGYGSNVEFDSPDAAVLKKNIDFGKELVKLSHDVGGSGVKVKPNKFHENVPREKTLEQIGKSLNELARFGRDYGQKIRLEVHGKGTQDLPNIKAIMDVADDPNAVVCWNCNPTDLEGKGFKHNFNLVKDRLGDTIHIHELDTVAYPWEELMTELVNMNYDGWTLWECSSNPKDPVAALTEQRRLWGEMLTKISK